jgi:hypothetical protein
MRALPPCVLPTFKARGEHYYSTSEVRNTQTTHVSSTIKVCQKYAHNVDEPGQEIWLGFIKVCRLSILGKWLK